MNIVGIIAEFNPLHKGHEYLLREARQRAEGGIVCVMSGSVTQRGEVAIIDKWRRGEMAVRCGADLAIELPTAFVLGSAQTFALGGVTLLKRLGPVTHIAFGSEFDDGKILEDTARLLGLKETQEKIREKILVGHAYGAAVREIIASTPIGTPRPNTVLALEYLRCAREIAPELIPVIIKRRGAYLSRNISGEFTGARALRELLRREKSLAPLQKFLPYPALPLWPDSDEWADDENLFRAFLAKLIVLRASDAASFIGVGEGLEHRLLREAAFSHSREDLLRRLRSKRYAGGRLSRAMLGILLRFTQKEQNEFSSVGPLYARVLAFNAAGREILRRIKQKSALPIITKVTPHLNQRDFRQAKRPLTPLQKMLRLDLRATLIQGAAMSRPSLAPKDYLVSPSFVKSDYST